MPIRLHDTRRREKVNFTTLEPGKVSMYVCGVTVYDRCHLGHARCYLAFDLIHRWLEASGYDVHYVQNFTDIDDKIIHRANELGGDWKALVDQNIETYYEDMDALNILRADDYPRCTEYVDDMIRITQDLIVKNHAYVADDGVYFDVESAPEKYGQLTGQSIDAVLPGAGGRVGDTGSGSATTRTSPCGKRPSPMSRHGIRRGGLEGRVGTLSARRCQWIILARSLTSTAVGTTCGSLITKQKSVRESATPGIRQWSTTGCTMVLSTLMEKK